MIIRFLPEADVELHEALNWYAQQKLGLDKELMRCIDEIICLIQDNPYLFPIALRDTRKAMIKKFPYTLYYEIADKELVILAVFHAKRSPKIWQKRMG